MWPLVLTTPINLFHFIFVSQQNRCPCRMKCQHVYDFFQAIAKRFNAINRKANAINLFKTILFSIFFLSRVVCRKARKIATVVSRSLFWFIWFDHVIEHVFPQYAQDANKSNKSIRPRGTRFRRKWWKMWFVAKRRKAHRMHLVSCLGSLEQTTHKIYGSSRFAVRTKYVQIKIIRYEYIYTFLTFVRVRSLGLDTWIDCLSSTNAHTMRRYQLHSKCLMYSLH